MKTADSAASVFVGESRKRAVDHLVALFDEVRNGSGSRVVVFASQPGWGKTRIVQEFYRRLAASQSQLGTGPRRSRTTTTGRRGRSAP